MICELRTYTLVPGGVRDYLRIYNEIGREVQVGILGDLVAFLQPESGDLNQLVFLWRFDSFEERRTRRRQLLEDARFTEFRKAVRHLLVRQESQLLSAV
ncbi:NIPSNAP family protein [Azoarcus sp. DD4]|uniref:NIPSNAP family protein n=1 Tax=Azoarcus sp. DD4 TaxID=2027405 RepID=UPI001126EBB4|nr:NIPSNAP family protein [Azoarcus sp. DD4]QDF98025.1 NIPSNAP family protein [Azoarcus sp. DD4]